MQYAEHIGKTFELNIVCMFNMCGINTSIIPHVTPKLSYIFIF